MRAAEFTAADIMQHVTPRRVDEVFDSLKNYFSSLASPHGEQMKMSSGTMQRYIQYFIDEMMQVAAKYKIDIDPRIPDPVQVGRYTIDKNLAKLVDRSIDQSTLQYLPIRVLTMFMRGAMQLPDAEVAKIWKRFNDSPQNSSFKLQQPLSLQNALGDATLLDIWGPKGANLLGQDRSTQSRQANRLISRLISAAAMRKMELDHLLDKSDSDYQEPTAPSRSDVPADEPNLTAANILSQYDALVQNQQILAKALEKMVGSDQGRDAAIEKLSPMAAKTVLGHVVDMMSDKTKVKRDDPLSVIALAIMSADASERKALIKALNQRTLLGSMTGQTNAKFGKAARASTGKPTVINLDATS